ncbi:hypothetical protein THASP1DRAFT_28465 [Thamnocephalis sphaerospora]|uniref:3-oxo-5-alpha-steroid 4-dehydrogenase C-terminal domain-containing protein n=1 Tax=Thamnocephalis sphaerospora TaxID=78915 RepID=A0A4P9XU71_9FUNG|nr:hypothetical protein THASP1DRAFT_28465 [Thamnocephalis sphaerospora]|eukprot:RKP09753.1 hypothetical protein THASP1DRAFT_28465 [Thamnocephalis sphaerospora]
MPDTFEVAMGMLFVTTGAIVGYSEATGQFNLPFSKFQEAAFGTWMTSAGPCDPRRAFLLMYASGFIVCVCSFWEYGTWHSPYHVVAGGFLIGQQIKRMAEVLWVHNNSGQLTNVMAAILCLINLAITTTCAHAILRRAPSSAEDRFRALAWPIPLVILAWSGNLYHHWILAGLRPSTPIRRYNPVEAYRIPRRGWFLRAACPHYYFEALAWLAFALIVNRASVYGVAIAVALFLAGRSYRTR